MYLEIAAARDSTVLLSKNSLARANRLVGMCVLVTMTVLAFASWSLAEESQSESVNVGNIRRAVPEDHTLSTVYVRVGASQGSGFFLTFDDTIYFVTAKHIPFNLSTGKLYDSEMRLLFWSHPQAGPSKRGLMVLNLEDANSANELWIEDTSDLLAVRIGSGGPGEPLKLACYVSSRGSLITTERTNLLLFEDVIVGNDVYVYGYPQAIGLKNVPQVDFSYPLLRRGTVAAVNPKLRTIILDLMVHGGNSGGPVWQVEKIPTGTKFRIVGVISQFVPIVEKGGGLGNSGYAVAAPLDVVIEMIEAGVAKRDSGGSD